jgi:hypothetical protein
MSLYDAEALNDPEYINPPTPASTDTALDIVFYIYYSESIYLDWNDKEH